MAKGNKTADYTDPQPGCEYYFLVWYDMNTNELIGWVYLGEWCPDDGENPYGNEGGGGGGGGDGCSSCPPQPPPPDILNEVTDPCLSPIVSDLKSKNIKGIIADILTALDGDKNVRLHVVDAANTATGAPATTDNIEYYPSTKIFEATITLGTETLNATTKENVAAVIIHEVVHAYLSYTNNGLFVTASHQKMATDYVTPMANFLSSAYGMTQKDATALAWSGVSDAASYNNASTFTYPTGPGTTATMTKSELGEIYGDYISRASGTPACP